MSDMGLNASIYEQLRAYADRFDNALIKLRSKDKRSADNARKDLVLLLREISKRELDKPGLQLIAMILKDEFSASCGNLEEAFQVLADTLEEDAASAEDFKRIEEIASVIDKECMSTSARLQGRA